MSLVRPASPGKTRACPHCKAVILESASVCPGCEHHLRFGSDAGSKAAARTALQVEGKIRHPRDAEPWEYSVVVFVRNERGEEIARHVINVGALANSEERVVSLQVDVMPPKVAVAPAARPAAPAAVPAGSPLAAARPPLVPPAPAPSTSASGTHPALGAGKPGAPGAPARGARPSAPSAGSPVKPPPPPGQPLPPAKETLAPPRPGDPYTSPFGRGPKPR